MRQKARKSRVYVLTWEEFMGKVRKLHRWLGWGQIVSYSKLALMAGKEV